MAVKPSDIKIRNEDYYQNREEKKADRYYSTVGKVQRLNDKNYVSHMQEIEDELDLFYSRYGTIQESPVIEGVGAGVVSTETSKKLVVTRQDAMKKQGDKTRLSRLKGCRCSILIKIFTR